jgi:hypothetical protein
MMLLLQLVTVHWSELDASKHTSVYSSEMLNGWKQLRFERGVLEVYHGWSSNRDKRQRCYSPSLSRTTLGISNS